MWMQTCPLEIIFTCSKYILNKYMYNLNMGVSWGGIWGPRPPPVTEGAPKKKRRRRKRKGKEKKKMERKVKRKKEKSTWRKGCHLSTSRGTPEGLKGRKLQGCQIDGGWGRHFSTLLQGAKSNDSLPPPPGLRPPGYAPVEHVVIAFQKPWQWT